MSRLDEQRMVLGHDYLIQMGGAERVVAALHRIFPHAPIYTSAVAPGRLLPDFRDAKIHRTWMQHLPGIDTHFKKYFPLYPLAFRSFGRLDAEVAVVSSSGFAKWLRFTPRTKVFCYCHTPPRFFWQTDDYLAGEVRNAALRLAARAFIPALRRSDFRAAQRVDHFIANSQCVRTRIRECYGREAEVIFPPVEVGRFNVTSRDEGYWLVLARLVAYKGIDRAVRAFSESGRRLRVVGDGPDRARLEAMAGPAVEFTGQLPDAEVKHQIEGCRALIFPGLEDFGIAPVEAQAAGKPVLAFGAGGALETVIDGVTGMFFTDPTSAGINAAIERFERMSWDPARIRAHAGQFAEARFAAALREFIEERR
jgi:glycosyltransferase involved in cell wall biosynthesis